MKTPNAPRFGDQKDGFRQILSDPHWLAKVLLGGFLLINPFLVALAPAYFSGQGPAWVKEIFPWILGFQRSLLLVSARLHVRGPAPGADGARRAVARLAMETGWAFLPKRARSS